MDEHRVATPQTQSTQVRGEVGPRVERLPRCAHGREATGTTALARSVPVGHGHPSDPPVRHPCLPGERDGDGDGYRAEGR